VSLLLIKRELFSCWESWLVDSFCPFNVTHPQKLLVHAHLLDPRFRLLHLRCFSQGKINASSDPTRIWANAQHDGRPAEYRCRPVFNAAKFGWCPLLACRAVTLPRGETRWNLHGCRKHSNRSQPLVGWSSPYYENMWRYLVFNKFFFRLSIHALIVKI